MIFEPGTDLYEARQVVQERMTQAHALPHVSKPPVMLAAAVLVEPGDDDRPVVGRSCR